MHAMSGRIRRTGLTPWLLATTLLAGTFPAVAQDMPASPPPPVSAPAPAAAPTVADTVQAEIIKSLNVTGTQRLEPVTVLSYIKLRVGQAYSQQAADQALKDLYATELFARASIRNDNGVVVIDVEENPVINRIVLEGNKKVKDDKILPEIKLAARQIYTRSKVRADVARIIELYKRQGRFAATVEPKAVELDQNRVDIVFEISEGPKSKVRQINILGNEKFSDGDLRGEMVTKQSRFFRLFSSGTSYDPDRLAYDQQKLRQFYLTNGYADFRVVSAVAELTPDKQDFIITYVVEEGDRYKFGNVAVESQLRDFKAEDLQKKLPMKTGEWYNAKQVEDTVEGLSEQAGLLGYAFADIRPDFNRVKETLTMDITFRVGESPRVYVERVDINGNTLTKDKVIRREFRLSEGDAFNSFLVKRSANRIKSLGYFQEDLEIEQTQGSAPDRIILTTNVEEKATGELQLSAGFSSIESFIFQASIRQRNFRGMGQELRASASYSRYSKSVELGFTEPYFLDKNIALSGDIYRRDVNSFNFINNNRNTTYEQSTTGFQIRTGVPINEFLYGSLRYGLNYDDITLDRDLFFTNGVCDPILAGRYLCDAIGKRTTSTLGFSVVYDTLDNRARPTRGTNASISVDFAGLGGSVKYLRTRVEASQYFPVLGNFIFSVSGEGGYIHPLENRGSAALGIDDVRLTDRFFLGEPQVRGFDIRGIGPRVQRLPFAPSLNAAGNIVQTLVTDSNRITDDAIGGRVYYLGKLELEIPLGSGAKELGLRPSIFMDAGAVFDVVQPLLVTNQPRLEGGRQVFLYKDTAGAIQNCTNTATDLTCSARPGAVPALSFTERFLGDSWKPRLSVGAGVNWNSPFGPFRIDIAKVLLKERGDDTKLITFNVGTQF